MQLLTAELWLGLGSKWCWGQSALPGALYPLASPRACAWSRDRTALPGRSPTVVCCALRQHRAQSLGAGRGSSRDNGPLLNTLRLALSPLIIFISERDASGCCSWRHGPGGEGGGAGHALRCGGPNSRERGQLIAASQPVNNPKAPSPCSGHSPAIGSIGACRTSCVARATSPLAPQLSL